MNNNHRHLRMTVLAGTISTADLGNGHAMFEGKNPERGNEAYAYQIPLSVRHREIEIDLEDKRPLRLSKDKNAQGDLKDGLKIRLLTQFDKDTPVGFFAWASEEEWSKANEELRGMREIGSTIYRAMNGEKIVPNGTGTMNAFSAHFAAGRLKREDLTASGITWKKLKGTQWDPCPPPNFDLWEKMQNQKKPELKKEIASSEIQNTLGSAMEAAEKAAAEKKVPQAPNIVQMKPATEPSAKDKKPCGKKKKGDKVKVA